ncbi:hypothetical protein O181_077777 [Austropuccinia psidii MF-1]|uniref:RRM domain-containing protein n=1 Tax=Austropuccinia psidii MF-1 TaxID=1389203 RepID=A0A9Q3IF04_9BASI|nr:hypothetical protein [Austropuccinia psidii MF-1]
MRLTTLIELSIDERIQRERPCRTLFVRNVKYETNSKEVREKFEQMGEIKIFFDLISTRGMVFITYYDLRAATTAKEKLQGSDVSGRPIDVHYSLPKDNELERRCDRDKNQATLFLAISGANRVIDDEELKVKFSAYGEIRSIKHFKDSPYQRFVEFWDSRACERAHDDLVGTQYLGGKLDLKFSWDTGMVPKTRLPKEYRGPGDENGYSYGYGPEDDPNNYDQDDGADYDHQDDNQYNTHHGRVNARRDNAYLRASNDQYGSHGSFQPGHSYPENPVPFGGEIDERRLDQAHKVQELLASLTKTGNQSTVGVGQTVTPGQVAAPYGLPSHSKDYSGDMSLSNSSQTMFAPSTMHSMPLPSNFVPNYPMYPAMLNDRTGQVGQINGSVQSYSQLMNTTSHTSNLQTVNQSHPTLQISNPAAAYHPLNDDRTNQATSLGIGNNSGVAQPSVTFPQSVLALLQQTGATGDSPYNNSAQQMSQLQPGGASSIPTAPRAMQGPMTNSNVVASQPAVNHALGVSIPAPIGGTSSTKPGTLSTTAPSTNQGQAYPTAGTSENNPQAAVQQLLALLRQQQQAR